MINHKNNLTTYVQPDTHVVAVKAEDTILTGSAQIDALENEIIYDDLFNTVI